ncbi:c-type cytochrome [Alteromonas sp. C1M14]|uniref:c-type cytochrome n=1 Tax=Alteromonas sp. C1M14 TaxID=2841567 RepID=UPI001C0A5286|nr:c-type cytochrome [Alteromonas sp. C1M14]MBU2979877.1 c-type cytochrome [Alteromonas sp. C1M14]
MLQKQCFIAILGLGMFQAAYADDTADKGKQVYNQACVMCHAAGISNAPIAHNTAQWEERVESKGMDTLLKNAMSGINQMPPMGLCAACSEEDLAAAIQYMMSETP